MKLAKIIDFIKSHIKINIYRVGDIILSANNRNPGLDYGGTWELWGAGRVPVGIDPSDSDFNSIEKTGGEKNHTLTISEIPSHSHSITTCFNANGFGSSNTLARPTGGTIEWKDNETFIKKAGGDQAHNNLQPYITCYMWKKIS